MYPPFELNDLIGPSIALNVFAAAVLVVLALYFYKSHLDKEEEGYRKN